MKGNWKVAHLFFVPFQEIFVIVFKIGSCCGYKDAAEFSCFFKQIYFMAAQCADSRCLHAAQAASDYHDFFLCLCRF